MSYCNHFASVVFIVCKDYTIGIYCFPTRALWSKSKDGLACNQHDASEWSGMSSRGIVLLN